MSQNTQKIDLLEKSIEQEEKKFLIGHYARYLTAQLENENLATLEDSLVRSLLVARTYADAELATRITNILEAHGHNEPWDPTVEEINTIFGAGDDEQEDE